MNIRHLHTGEIIYTHDGESLRCADLCRANLSGADLRGAILRWADLRGAILYRADLSEADLRGAILRWANLCGADLRGAILRWADLRGAILRGADLRGAILYRADLSGAILCRAILREAILCGADLRGAILYRADLSGADLTGTVLDPNRAPLGGYTAIVMAGFRVDDEGWVYGYRSRRGQVGGTDYAPRPEPYIAPVLSTCPDTDCHPGIYLAPSVEWIENYYVNSDLACVRCRCRIERLHRGVDKWRTNELYVLGDA